MAEPAPPNQLKIVVAGLDYAGKTSIIQALETVNDDFALKPTVGVEYHKIPFLGQELVLWDLGGQEQYRERFLNRRDVYFSEIDILLFVVDSTDERKRYEGAFSYFKKIAQTIKEQDLDPTVFVFFHKSDPDNRLSPAVEKELIAMFSSVTEELSLKIRFRQTTIFNIWELIRSFSDALLEKIPKKEVLADMLKQYAERVNCRGLLLFDGSSFLVSEWFKAEQDKNAMDRYGIDISYIIKFFPKILRTADRLVLGSQHLFYIVRMPSIMGKTYYIVVFISQEDIGSLFGTMMDNIYEKVSLPLSTYLNDTKLLTV